MSESGGNRTSNDFCNVEYLQVKLGSNSAAADRLVQIFIESSPLLCQRLEVASQKRDLLALKDVLHDIRSSCALFSATRCIDQARHMEQLVREHLLESREVRSVPDWRSISAPLILCIQCMSSELAAYLASREI